MVLYPKVDELLFDLDNDDLSPEKWQCGQLSRKVVHCLDFDWTPPKG